MKFAALLVALAGLQHYQVLANPVPLPGDLIVRTPDSNLIERSIWAYTESGHFWYGVAISFSCVGYLMVCSATCLYAVNKVSCIACLLSVAVVETCIATINYLKDDTPSPSGDKFKRTLQINAPRSASSDPHAIPAVPAGYLPDCSGGDICYGKPVNGTQVVGLCTVSGYAKQIDNYARAQKNGGGCSSIRGANGGMVTRDCDISVKPQQGCGVITN